MYNFKIGIKGDGGDVTYDGGGGPCLRLRIDFDDFLVPGLICGTFDEKKNQIPPPHFPPFFSSPPPFLKICET